MKLNKFFNSSLLITLVFTASSCQNQTGKNHKDGNDTTSVDSSFEYGTDPSIKAPYSSDTVTKFAKIVGWKDDNMPSVKRGFKVTKFADSLNSPRNIYISPEGDIYVALARTEKKGEDPEKEQSRNTFRSTSPNQIYRFIDADNDGVAESKELILDELNQPYGMLILGDYFYVANTDGLLRFSYDRPSKKVGKKAEKILSLPAGGYNNHWTRNLIANKDGSKIYVSVGSGSNVGENGMQHELHRAAILEVNPDGTQSRIFAAGIRNPVGMDWEPSSGELWTAVNERDQLGDELVPDYITSVKANGWYGWPYTYWGNHTDPRWQGKIPDSISKEVITPDFALGSHTASLGLAFSNGGKFPAGAFVSQHGSWNRSTFIGYKVIFIPFVNGKPSGGHEDFLTGFIKDESTNEVYGRPVDVAFTDNYLLLSDDAANCVWAIIPE